jgi:hypothetical protein
MSEVAAADLDGNGTAEVAVSAAELDGGRGGVFVYAGAADRLDGPMAVAPVHRYVGTIRSDVRDQAGAWLDHGDLDGDGLADLVIPAPSNATGGENFNRIYIVRGGSEMAGRPSPAPR